MVAKNKHSDLVEKVLWSCQRHFFQAVTATPLTSGYFGAVTPFGRVG
jgi:hypothetical protein